MKKIFCKPITTTLLIVICVIVLGGRQTIVYAAGNSAPDVSCLSIDKSTPAPDMANLGKSIAKVAADNIPAVVHIEVTQNQEINNPLVPFENDPFFHYFFNVPKDMPRKFKRELKGLGTGMIINPRGHILTNNHVVGGADKIQVLLADGTDYEAVVVGTDPKTDLAVIKIEADGDLPYVTFCDSDQVVVGDWVVAIGHPRGLDQTVTQGIISAKHRRGILDPSSYQDYLQTDAAINPGNSGGPLLNLSGRVIGVNAAIVSESGGFEGIGFAIPCNIATHVAQALITYGKVERGWMGAGMSDITRAMAKSMNLDSAKGALVQQVVKDGPAEAAGLQKNDVIVAFEGQPVTDASMLQDKVANAAIGTEAVLTVLRDRKKMELQIKIGNLEDAIQKMAAAAQESLGAMVRPVTEKEAQQYGMPTTMGVAIVSLVSGGPLAQAGFEVDDLILAINQTPVPGVAEFADVIESLTAGQRVQITALDHKSGRAGNVMVQVK